MTDTICPVCNSLISECQCLFSGSAHTDKEKQYDVVKDHLYLLSIEQLKHLINLQRNWQIGYEDEQKNQILTKLKGVE